MSKKKKTDRNISGKVLRVFKEIEATLNNGADINYQDKDRNTPLHCVFTNEHISVSKITYIIVYLLNGR